MTALLCLLLGDTQDFNSSGAEEDVMREQQSPVGALSSSHYYERNQNCLWRSSEERACQPEGVLY